MSFYELMHEIYKMIYFFSILLETSISNGIFLFLTTAFANTFIAVLTLMPNCEHNSSNCALM